LLLESKGILEAKLGTDYPEYADILTNLAWVYYAAGDFQEVENLYRKALDIYKAKLGKDHPQYATTLNNWAAWHYAIGDFQKAKTLYWQALEINEVKLGKHHLRYAATLNNLALLQVATDHPRDALRLMQEEAKIENQVLGQIFSISSDVQRLIYLQQIRSQLEIFLSVVTQYLPDAPDAVQAAFDLVLRRKALSAEAAAMQRTAILRHRYRHLAPQLEQLRQLDNQIASLAWNLPPPEQLAAYQTQLATLYHQRDELDRSLSREIPEMNLQKQLDTANRRAIAQTLPDGTTLVEFVRFDVFNFKAILA
jgi:tetratricopeptide (TPR) repeat protein